MEFLIKKFIKPFKNGAKMFSVSKFSHTIAVLSTFPHVQRGTRYWYKLNKEVQGIDDKPE